MLFSAWAPRHVLRHHRCRVIPSAVYYQSGPGISRQVLLRGVQSWSDCRIGCQVGFILCLCFRNVLNSAQIAARLSAISRICAIWNPFSGWAAQDDDEMMMICSCCPKCDWYPFPFIIKSVIRFQHQITCARDVRHATFKFTDHEQSGIHVRRADDVVWSHGFEQLHSRARTEYTMIARRMRGELHFLRCTRSATGANEQVHMRTAWRNARISTHLQTGDNLTELTHALFTE